MDGTGKGLTKSGAASRRYRQRLHDMMSGLEAEVTQKMQQLQLLTSENEMLKLRASVLGAAVAGREDVVRMTHVHGPPVYDASSSSTTTSNSSSSSSGSAEAALRLGRQA
ncbi:hypothetical protein OEZ85_008867 [Tetradesmus obliquus]|uniref:BZIP domain-containing protein n=1 Tax=Tetradesmus obliquus TaxID=3088 RepID=A0ABY8TNT3_TETOB|nr:hypothetical protein OEZ85_008867 [Tetradesmus obliquus]